MESRDVRETHGWDIFCRVVDYFGDAGVCWRLARQLAAEHGGRVRLFIDDLASLARLHPAIRPLEVQRVDGVEVHHWRASLTLITPGDIVIEAFGCGLPDEYVNVMVRAARPPVWIVLEYLSAEPWVAEHHGRPSPHPHLPLERYFFFPGFVPGTGGLLREADLFARRDRYDKAQRGAFWRSLGFDPPPESALTVSVFAYEHAPLAELLNAWERGERALVAAIPEGPLVRSALGHFSVERVGASRVLARDTLELRVLPFLPQARYDELLWACDCNFVRGEDSFVRAQWAARPFVWHVYPQAEHAHWRKLDAFLSLYGEGLPARPRDAVDNFMRAWNQCDVPGVTVGSAWGAFAAEVDHLRDHGRAWADRIGSVGALAANLARFCHDKLK
jgi:uncharacterized repeat protein (TIGR03837 family)